MIHGAGLWMPCLTVRMRGHRISERRNRTLTRDMFAMSVWTRCREILEVPQCALLKLKLFH